MQTAPQMLEPARNPRKKSWSSWAARLPILWGVLVSVNLQAAFLSRRWEQRPEWIVESFDAR
jgi:hypothetical protein